jgi:hypothetical protein
VYPQPQKGIKYRYMLNVDKPLMISNQVTKDNNQKKNYDFIYMECPE